MTPDYEEKRTMARIAWTEAGDPPPLHEGPHDWPDCQCRLADDPRCTLAVEEGSATLTHDACRKPLPLYQEDIWAEFPVTVSIETCSNPGGWHGMERCDCGPTVAIEHDASR